MEEVTASVPVELLRHIYFALSAAKQDDPDNAQLAYLLDYLKKGWPDYCPTPIKEGGSYANRGD